MPHPSLALLTGVVASAKTHSSMALTQTVADRAIDNNGHPVVVDRELRHLVPQQGNTCRSSSVNNQCPAVSRRCQDGSDGEIVLKALYGLNGRFEVLFRAELAKWQVDQRQPGGVSVNQVGGFHSVFKANSIWFQMSPADQPPRRASRVSFFAPSR